MKLSVVRASAGCGKTTEVARRYLQLIRSGVPAQRIIAITFTRKAAAELISRVSAALATALPDPAHPLRVAGERHLGASVALYSDALPTDPRLVRDALEWLPEAPIGTTDAFVSKLLSHHALHARLRLSTGASVALDVPIGAGGDCAGHRRTAARAWLNQAEPSPACETAISRLLHFYGLDELVPLLGEMGLDHRPASAEEVLGSIARDIARAWAKIDIASDLSVPNPTEPASWEQVLRAHTHDAQVDALPAVCLWMAAGRPLHEAPFELVCWLRQTRGLDPLLRALKSEVRAYGPGDLRLIDALDALAPPFHTLKMIRRADHVRAALEHGRQWVHARAMRSAAAAGDLDYEMLLRAAITLCEEHPVAIRESFDALLVDEVQDANPGQLRLYRALAAAGGSNLEGCFVGDMRQSIYLFRQAEPAGFQDILATAEQQSAVTSLVVNHRSHSTLVRAAVELFGALDPAMRRQRWAPLESLAQIRANPANEALVLPADHPGSPSPVHIIQSTSWSTKQRERDQAALYHFLQRVESCWSGDGSDNTAAVLVARWADAQWAARALNGWVRNPIAFVEGQPLGTRSPVVADLRELLTALYNPDDAVAWFAVWKQPAFGLSDAALARITSPREGEPRWRAHLGRTLEHAELDERHDPWDRELYARVAPHLRRATQRVGRVGSCAVLEELVSATGWREVLRAGPGGSTAVEQLDQVLEWIATRDAAGVSVPQLLAELAPDQRIDLPGTPPDPKVRSITVTTIFQAKGLAWDHVMVLQPGTAVNRSASRETSGWMQIDGERLRLEGLQFDPTQGLTRAPDPIAHIVRSLATKRYAEETARTLYVAITRARRSVTFALPKPPSRKQKLRAVSDLLGQCWSKPGISGVALLPMVAPPAPGKRQRYEVEVVGDSEPLPVRDPREGWVQSAPSGITAGMPRAAKHEAAIALATAIVEAQGVWPGHTRLDPPGTTPGGRPVVGHRLEHLTPPDWGNIAHGWMARWAFQGQSTLEAATTYLQAEWGAPDEAVAHWLVAMSKGLATTAGPAWSLVTHPESSLHFEVPMVGLGSGLAGELLLSGRIDLLVRLHGTTTVIDFKAGTHSPSTSIDPSELARSAALASYGPQLRAYASALTQMGEPADRLILWFVRTGAQVSWQP